MYSKVIVTTTLVLAGSAFADLTTYSSEAAFRSAAAGVGAVSMESFENLPATNAISLTSATLDDFVVSVDSRRFGIYDHPRYGLHATDGSQYLYYSSLRDSVMTLEFDESINSFGLYVTDFGDIGRGRLVFSNSAGDSFTAAASRAPSGDEAFFGIVNTDISFNVVQFINQSQRDGDAYGIDQIYYSKYHHTPAPGAALLGLIGMGMVGWMKKRFA